MYSIKTHTEFIKGLCLLTLSLLLLSISTVGQSPKKYFKNGFYEKAFVNAIDKQNRKVKLKSKLTEVIYPSYKIMYQKHIDIVMDSENTWDDSYGYFLRIAKYRAMVTHPGVIDNLQDVYKDKSVLDILANKTNELHFSEMTNAEQYLEQKRYDEAMTLYKSIAGRQKAISHITTLSKRIDFIDIESYMEETEIKMGDELIAEARELLSESSKERANQAKDLIRKAEIYRPLSIEEQELRRLADIMIGESWIEEAKRLIASNTKQNARIAYELLVRATDKRTLTNEEEQLKTKAYNLGLSRILVKTGADTKGSSAEDLAGHLNKLKPTQWLAYYTSKNTDVAYDFEMEISDQKPNVKLDPIRKQIKQNSRMVQYYEEVTDSTGNTSRVRKERLAVAMIAIFSQTKNATLDWSITLRDLRDGKLIFSEQKESRYTKTNQYVSLESGDILALPENIESDVNLDSQPFPSNKEMETIVTDQYLHELAKFVNGHRNHILMNN